MPLRKAKGGDLSSNIQGGKPFGNTQEGSAKTISADPNTQLQSSNESNNPALASSIEDNMDIDTTEKIIEIPTSEASASTERQQDIDNPHNTYLTLTPVLSELSVLAEVEKQILMLEERKHKLHLQLKLKSLLAEKAEGFPLLTASSLSEQTTSQRRTKMLAIERAKRVRVPNIYKGQSQKHFDKFRAQLDDIFSAQLTIYGSKEDKSRYVGSFCKDTFRTDWEVYKKRLLANLESEYSFSELLQILQDTLVFKKIRQVNVESRLWKVSQHNNQSVPELISHILSLENQLDFKLQDQVKRLILLEAVHSYLKQVLILRNQVGTTRLELKEALQSIEGVEPPPPGVTVKQVFGMEGIAPSARYREE